MHLTTYYPNGKPYIVEERIGQRIGGAKVYNTNGTIITVLFYDSDSKMTHIAYGQNGLNHNLYGPAWIYWRSNGKIARIEYLQNNLQHNLYGPAIMDWKYYYMYQFYMGYYQNGILLKLHEPSYII